MLKQFALLVTLLGVVFFVASCSSNEEVPPAAPAVEEPKAPEAPAPVAAQLDATAITFDYDQYTINEASKASLQVKADYLKANAAVKVQVEGHCDERGSNQYNLALGEKRANATKEYLVSLGVNAEQVSTISYGEERPADQANTEEAWAKNRRAEFIVK